MSNQNFSMSRMEPDSSLNRPYARTLLMRHFTIPELNLIKYDLGIDQGITSPNSPDIPHFTDLLLYIERRNMVEPFIKWLKSNEGIYNFEPGWQEKILENQHPPPNNKKKDSDQKEQRAQRNSNTHTMQIGAQFVEPNAACILSRHQPTHKVAKFNFAFSLWLVLICHDNNQLYLVELILLIPLL